ncbi:MAG TPA: hypothetical protein VGC22_12670 [Chitinophaga sp.]
MIKYNDARIFEWITQKILGTICAEDDALLQEAIAAHAQVKCCWEELNGADMATGHTLLQYLDAAEVWLLLHPEHKPLEDAPAETPPPFPARNTRVSRAFYWWALAALLALAFILYGCFRPATQLVAQPAAGNRMVIRRAEKGC